MLILIPLYLKMGEDIRKQFSYMHEIGEAKIYDYLNRYREIALQVSSRTQAKKLLAACEGYTAANCPEKEPLTKILRESMDSSQHIITIVRLNNRWQPVVSTADADPELIDDMRFHHQYTPNDPKYHYGYTYDGKPVIIIYSPVLEGDEFIGADLVFFETESIFSELKRYKVLGQTYEALLGYYKDGHYQVMYGEEQTVFLPFITKKYLAESDGIRSTETKSHRVLTSTLGNDALVFVTGAEKKELYETLRQEISLILFAVFALVSLAMGLIFLTLRPIKKQLYSQIQTIQETREELEKKTDIMISQSRLAAMGEMISMIAHQWRQPITAIGLNVNNMLADIELEEFKEDHVKRHGKNILQQVTFLSKTIDDFRNFFRPNREMELIDPYQIIQDTLAIIQKSYQNSDIGLDVQAEPCTPFKTYSREIIQVLLNLLKNASDAIESNRIHTPKVILSLKEFDTAYIISISDNAGGIDPAHTEKIFEPYFSTKDEKNGTGLGLYMSKIIVEKHLRGKIEYVPLNEGSCFKLTLPKSIGE